MTTIEGGYASDNFSIYFQNLEEEKIGVIYKYYIKRYNIYKNLEIYT